MPIIRVDMFEGRTPEQKRALATALTQACVTALGSPPETVQVMLFDVAKSHWATAGVFASEKAAAPKPAGS